MRTCRPGGASTELHISQRSPGRRAVCAPTGGGKAVTFELAKLVLDIVKFGFTAVVLVIIALLLS